MTASPSWTAATDWLTIPEVAEALGETPGRVRRLLDEHSLVAVRHEGALRVPAVFLVDDRPLSSLRGTVIVLRDAGFTDEEAVEWLLSRDEIIGDAPIDALRAGRKHEVRRVAKALA
ncbi:Rv2175c family DNA-binding protein [Microbacterium sp. LRZ72]|uniref:Rv2175c family DNA-binding protein n=1 Tax=Microbacterium sp. LRZ72 TaxID=2942481 RepID=UPI0029B4EE83|nr:Rv2175c family DNA-binding protein [Microbacterium sp. LRZ72]MDX2377161.1 Rv2175c family DNA-binding protein [Microbacterium sp. LRZ72]